MRSSRRPRVNDGAKLSSVDLAAEDDEGTPYGIWPCEHCIPWHAEVIRDGDDVFVREWHASGCPGFQELARVGVTTDPGRGL
jgi:hypothetical protein